MRPLEARMAHIEGTYEQVSQRLAGFELRFDAIDRRFEAIDRRFEAIDHRFDAVDRRFDLMDRKIETFRSEVLDKLDGRFMWTIGVVLGTWITTILAVIFRH